MRSLYCCRTAFALLRCFPLPSCVRSSPPLSTLSCVRVTTLPWSSSASRFPSSSHKRFFSRRSLADVPVKNIKPKILSLTAAMTVNEYDGNRSASSTPRPYTVFIEGNVGSGKTTFLEQFADCPNVFMAKEPVHKWQDVRGHNFLVSIPSLAPPPSVLCLR